MNLRTGKALISDDTQMTLFTAGGLLCATTRGWYKGIPVNHLRDVQAAYLNDIAWQAPP